MHIDKPRCMVWYILYSTQGYAHALGLRPISMYIQYLFQPWLGDQLRGFGGEYREICSFFFSFSVSFFFFFFFPGGTNCGYVGRYVFIQGNYLITYSV